MHLLRRPTDPALERARNARRRPTLPSDPQPSRVQEKYPAYEDFPWEEIEKFLKLKWPLWTEFNPTMVCALLDEVCQRLDANFFYKVDESLAVRNSERTD
jgi:hypothetical protein